MGVCDEDYEITRAGSVVSLRMLRDVDDSEVIASIAETLKTYLQRRSEKVGLMQLLIDLRLCTDFKPKHVFSTVAILVGEKDAVLTHLSASAVLMHLNMAIEPLKAMFDRLYKPVRPFSLFDDEVRAKRFLSCS